MNRLSTRVDQACHRQFQFSDQGVLLCQIHAVRFNQGVPEVRDIIIPDSGAIQRIEANPCSSLGFNIAHDRADVALTLVQCINEFAGSSVPVPLCREVSTITFPYTGDISHLLFRREQRLQILNEIIYRAPLFVGWLLEFLILDPCRIQDTLIITSDRISPVQLVPIGRDPAVLFGHLDDGSTGDRVPVSQEGVPFLLAFPLVVSGLSSRPVFPYAAVITLFFQSHSYIQPFSICAPGRIDIIQYFS